MYEIGRIILRKSMKNKSKFKSVLFINVIGNEEKSPAHY